MTARDHPCFGQPINSAVGVMRYMTYDKFEWMLRTKSLFFCRADRFADQLEGHYTKANPSIEERWVAHQIENCGFGAGPGPEDSLRLQYRQMLACVDEDKQETFVNCWHMSEHESLTMWTEFAAPHDSVCIKSRFDLLHALLPAECFLGGVRYIDYETDFIDPINSLNFITHKDLKHIRELEVRAVTWGRLDADKFPAVGDGGIAIPIDLGTLITAVHVSPYANPQIEDATRVLCRTHGVDVPVQRSDVAAPSTRPA
jgi:hypothetical protein